MPYDFAENEFELEPQASSARGGGPPRKMSGIGVLDPPVSPRKLPSSLFVRILAGLLLAGLAAATLLLLFRKH